MTLRIRRAGREDTSAVSAVLVEAAAWLEARGIPLWSREELQPDRIAADVTAGLYVLAEDNDAVVGTMRFQLEDAQHWPELPAQAATFGNRLANSPYIEG